MVVPIAVPLLVDGTFGAKKLRNIEFLLAGTQNVWHGNPPTRWTSDERVLFDEPPGVSSRSEKRRFAHCCKATYCTPSFSCPGTVPFYNSTTKTGRNGIPKKTGEPRGALPWCYRIERVADSRTTSSTEPREVREAAGPEERSPRCNRHHRRHRQWWAWERRPACRRQP